MASQKGIIAAAESIRTPSPEEASSNNNNLDVNLKGPPQACLFVASLSPITTEESLQQFFLPYGEIVKTKILKDRALRPYAFVQFKTVEVANEALQATHGQILDGRRLRVEKARVNRTLFIAKIDRNYSNTQVREICEEFGPVESVTIIRNHHTNQSKGCGFVKYEYREDAVEAFTNLKNSSRKLPWVIEWATSTNDPDLQGLDKHNLFIGGLNPRVTKDLLEERFSIHGKVESITLVNREIDRTEQTGIEDSSIRNAFCFLRYESENSSIAAIEQENGVEWMERRIRVQYCESPEMKYRRRQTKYFGHYMPYGMIPNPMMMMGGVYGDLYYNNYLGYPMTYNQPWMSYIPDYNYENQATSNSDPSTDNVMQAFSTMNLQESAQSIVAQY